MDYFLLDSTPMGQEASLDSEQTHHLRKVVRQGEGARVGLLDGTGGVYEATVTGYRGDRALCRIECVRHVGPPLAVDLTIAVAPPKATRMDFLVQKCVELGARRIIPVLAARSAVRPREAKIARWQRIADEALKQCRRAVRMPVTAPVEFPCAVEDADEAHRFIADPSGSKDLLQALKGVSGSARFLIGPEGGWTAQELDVAREAGFEALALGDSILRTETAALLVVSATRLLFPSPFVGEPRA